MIEKFLIGTYTHSISKGIYQLELDTQAKQLQNLQLVAEATNPTYLAESDAHRIYSVDKVLGPNDEAQGGVLVLDDQIPANQVDLQLDPGANPAYLAIDEPRQLVYTANYHLGTVSVYRILADGSLELTDRKTDQGMVGPRPEQADGPPILTLPTLLLTAG